MEISYSWCWLLLAASLSYGSFSSAQAQSTVTTVAGSGAVGNADGPASTAQFNHAGGVALDAQGTIYVADSQNNTIRKITPAGVVSVLAGNGTYHYADSPYGPFASFGDPRNLLVDAQGNLLVADTGNGSIRRIDSDGGVTTWAGTGQPGYVDGPGSIARFESPLGLAQDAAGNVYVADADNFRIRRIDPLGNVTTVAGTGVRGSIDGPANTARFYEPNGLALDAAGNLYIADGPGNRIRKLTPAGMSQPMPG